jgi:hypothetical protein
MELASKGIESFRGKGYEKYGNLLAVPKQVNPAA